MFLRAVNVGGTNLCRPAQLAKELKKFDIINIGAVGTFVIRKAVNDSTLRAAIAKKLPFKCEIMICQGRDITRLAAKAPFAGELSGPEFTRFVSVLHKKPRNLPFALPFRLPSDKEWLLKLIAIEKQFVLGIYRREMKAIGYLGRIEKILGAPATARSWSTIEKVARILEKDRPAADH